MSATTATSSTKPSATATRNTRALWDLTRGQRLRFAAALACLAIGASLMYVGPQIVRVAIDGILLDPRAGQRVPARVARVLTSVGAPHHPLRALVLAGCAVLAA